MGFVDIQHRLMFAFQLDEFRQVRVIAVHAVESFNRDQDTAILTSNFSENLVELAMIIVFEGAASSPAEHRPLNDRIVGKGIVNDQIAGAEEMPNDRFICRVTSWKRDDVPESKKVF